MAEDNICTQAMIIQSCVIQYMLIRTKDFGRFQSWLGRLLTGWPRAHSLPPPHPDTIMLLRSDKMSSSTSYDAMPRYSTNRCNQINLNNSLTLIDVVQNQLIFNNVQCSYNLCFAVPLARRIFPQFFCNSAAETCQTVLLLWRHLPPAAPTRSRFKPFISVASSKSYIFMCIQYIKTYFLTSFCELLHRKGCPGLNCLRNFFVCLP